MLRALGIEPLIRPENSKASVEQGPPGGVTALSEETSIHPPSVEERSIQSKHPEAESRVAQKADKSSTLTGSTVVQNPPTKAPDGSTTPQSRVGARTIPRRRERQIGALAGFVAGAVIGVISLLLGAAGSDWYIGMGYFSLLGAIAGGIADTNQNSLFAAIAGLISELSSRMQFLPTVNSLTQWQKGVYLALSWGRSWQSS